MIHKKGYTFTLSKELPEGQSGDYSIIKSIVPKGTLLRTYTTAGFFYFDHLGFDLHAVSLIKGEDETLMSDTPLEQEGLRISSALARGNVLIIGLGIGLLPTLIRHYRSVKKVLIVEESQDVVKLVYAYIKDKKTDIRVFEGKKFLMTCTEKFDFIYVDVWPSITATLKEIGEWTELATRCLTEDGTVRCWLQELYDRIKARLTEEPAGPSGPVVVDVPCLVCGKKFRNDYAGLCLDCADSLGLSEHFIEVS